MISDFIRRDWYQSGLKLMMGKGFNQPEQKLREHPLGDKTIADIAEAIIGAALISCMDTNNRDMAVRAVTALVCSLDHDVLEWSGYYRMYKKPQYQVVSPSAIHRELAEKFERKHGYHFSYPALLYSAFIHPSYPSAWSKGIPCYQRLEFLGDALLDMASINFLFHRHPDKDPQWLTEHKVW
jgi:endoribonuclease Dicer